ncbi:MAG TPA: hypothetical protein V6C52_12860 [Coleofasciculaceae cyanobacterium]|jgi:hypothetical protein
MAMETLATPQTTGTVSVPAETETPHGNADRLAPLAALGHPTLRPIILGVLVFALLNLCLTLGVTFSPLNRKFNFNYGNFLPTKLEMLQQHDPSHLDVLFMGTSQTNNGFITSVFERAAGQVPGQTQGTAKLNSFNLGLPNNRYDIMQAYLQMHVQKYGKPRLLLLELGPSIQEKDAYLFYLPALYYRTLIENAPTLAPTYLANPLLAQNVKEELLMSSVSSLHQYRYTFSPVNMLGKVSGKLKSVADRLQATPVQAETDSTNARDPFRNPTEQPMEILPEMTEKGWYPKERSPHMTTPAGVRLSVDEARRYYIDHQKEVNFEKLAALLAYCRAQKIPVVLVSWPNHPAFLKVYHRSPLAAKYQDGLRRLLTQAPVPMINLNNALPPWQTETDGGLFADPRHLTPEGARIFSAQLARDVFALPEVARIFTAGEPAHQTVSAAKM